MLNPVIPVLYAGRHDPLYSLERDSAEEKNDPIFQLRAFGKKGQFSNALSLIRERGMDISSSMLVYAAGVRDRTADKSGRKPKRRKPV